MSERDDIAKSFHNIYLILTKAFRWPVRPDVAVEFERLPRDAQELDYALADFHLTEIARFRAEVERLTWERDAVIRAAKQMLDSIHQSYAACEHYRSLLGTISKTRG